VKAEEVEPERGLVHVRMPAHTTVVSAVLPTTPRTLMMLDGYWVRARGEVEEQKRE
jgi:hypothetical protein